jgi:RNA polymerase sigma-70 factor, ECF subfamily
MIPTSVAAISPILGAMSDSELMGAMCNGQTEALEALFNRYARLVHRVAADILKDHVEAEDSTQEVFFEVYRKAHLYDPARGTVKGWLLRYAYRRTVRRKLLLGRRAAYHGESIDIVDEMQPPLPRLSQEECRWVLRSALAHLPERQRTTLELTCFEDLPLREVAERLGVSVGCTRHYYYRGLAQLQQWARVTQSCRSVPNRVVSRAGTAGAVRVQAPQPPGRA